MENTAKVENSDAQTTIWANNPKFLGNIFLRGKIETLTGLHIGGNQDHFAIGGVTATVVRSPRTLYPYIPGSSLKGKIRSLLEFYLGVVGVGAQSDSDLGQPSHDERIVRLFGIGAEKLVYRGEEKMEDYFISRSATFRDCHPDQTTINFWKGMDTELLYTELKAENSVGRITTEANPRFPERVVEGSFFDFEIIVDIYDTYLNHISDDLKNILVGMRLLESSSLGGNGTRGSGSIRFHCCDPILVTKEDYKEASAAYKSSLEPVSSKNNSLHSLDGISFDKVVSALTMDSTH